MSDITPATYAETRDLIEKVRASVIELLDTLNNNDDDRELELERRSIEMTRAARIARLAVFSHKHEVSR